MLQPTLAGGEARVHVLAACFARGLVLIALPRGRGGAGVRAAPAVSCATAQETAHLHTGSAESTPTSPTQWFYGVLRALPGERRCLPPSPAEMISTDLTPRSRRQDHTT